ncbi:MAG: CPBP family intramembrane metalloprotease [Actinomycetota bacterium]|nr:CPBP family intramembrane metalloprotease [Actinomycetota bacterium]
MSGQPVIEDRPPTGPPRWGLGDAVGGYAVAFLLMGLAAASWVALTGRRERSLGLVVVVLVAQWTGLVGAVVVASRRKGSGRLGEDFGFRVEARDVKPGLVAGLFSQFVLLPLLYLPVQLVNPDLDPTDAARRLTALGRGWGAVVLAACVVIGAPLVEELFFRGLLQRSLARRFGPAWGVGVSALAFGVVHGQPLQLLGLVAFGVVLGLLAQWSGRLGPSLVAHAVFNAATVVLLVVLR